MHIALECCVHMSKKTQDYVEDEPFNDVSKFSSVADVP